MLVELDEPSAAEVIKDNDLKVSFHPIIDGTPSSINVYIEGKFTFKNLDVFIEKMNYYLLRYKVFYITLKAIDRIDASAAEYLMNLMRHERYKTIVIEGFLSPGEKTIFYRSYLGNAITMN